MKRWHIDNLFVDPLLRTFLRELSKSGALAHRQSVCRTAAAHIPAGDLFQNRIADTWRICLSIRCCARFCGRPIKTWSTGISTIFLSIRCWHVPAGDLFQKFWSTGTSTIACRSVAVHVLAGTSCHNAVFKYAHARKAEADVKQLDSPRQHDAT